MLIPTLPFEYAKLTDRTDRLRRTRARPTGTRIRRGLRDDRGTP